MNDPIWPIWEHGRGEELDYWNQVLRGQGGPGRYRTELLERADPHREFPRWLAGYITTSALEDARILDIGAGPISILGWRLDGVQLNISAIDALADEFNDMLETYGIYPPVKTEQLEAERICERFPSDFFDLIHCRNALDHCYDPVRIVRHVMRLLKPDATMIVCSKTNEAVENNYLGFHQWNIDATGTEVIIWRPGTEHVLAGIIGNVGEVFLIDKSKDGKWFAFGVKKIADTSCKEEGRP